MRSSQTPRCAYAAYTVRPVCSSSMDSQCLQAAFKAAVEDWRTLPEEQKRLYTQQAGQLAEAAQVCVIV